MSGLSEIIAARRLERASRLYEMRKAIGYPVSDFVANKCLEHFDHVRTMPFATKGNEEFMASARSRAAVLSRVKA